MSQTSRGVCCLSHCRRITSTRPILPSIPAARPFHSSSARQKHGSVSTFSPTSSPELDDLLSTFRAKVFVPAHLLKRHRNLIYRKRNYDALQGEPVYVEIGSESFQLEPLDHLKDEPKLRPEFQRMLQLMKSQDDWQNLPGFLEELKISKRKLDAGLQEKMVRVASKAGRQDVIVECAKRVGRTGFALSDVKLVREVFWGLYEKAMRAGWQEEETALALAQAELVAELLEDHGHRGRRALGKGDPRCRPEVIGVLLALSTKNVEGKTVEVLDGKVATYAARLQATWHNADLEASELGLQPDSWQEANYRLQLWVPVLRGMRLATELLDPKAPVGMWIRKELPAMESVVERARVETAKEASPSGSRRGLELFNHSNRTL